MQIFKFLMFAFAFSIFLASCSKDSIVETIDVPPTVDPTIEEVTDGGTLTLNSLVIETDTLRVSALQPWGSDLAHGYSFGVESPLLNGAPGELFALMWQVATPEPNIEAGSYSGDQANSLDQATMMAIEQWFANGADTTNLPNIANTQYDASGVTIDVSNVSLDVFSETIDSFPDPSNPGTWIPLTANIDEANIDISGNMVDVNGNSIAVSGSFLARISRIDF